MLEQSQRVLLDAIKASLFGSNFSYPEDTDWDAVIKEAKSQTVLGLISPVVPIHDESSDQGKAYYMRLMYEQDKLLKLFGKHNIPCVILKGCAAAVYYPKPYLRAMGDVDILVPRSQFDEAMKLMDSSGYMYSHGKGEDGGLAFQSRHIGYLKNGIEFELHHHFSSTGFNMDDILENAIANREFRTLNGYRFPVLPETENGLVLLGHLFQHLNESNLGLRQIIDWEMYLHAAMNSQKWEQEFAPLAKQIGLFDLAVNITVMCEKHLGLSKTTAQHDHAEESITDEVLESILSSGNFGAKHAPETEHSGERIRSVTATIKREGFYSYFQNNGLATWKPCQKHPVLKPFAFIYGILRFFIRGVTGIFDTGNYKEEFKYVSDKSKFEKKLGIRTKETKK